MNRELNSSNFLALPADNCYYLYRRNYSYPSRSEKVTSSETSEIGVDLSNYQLGWSDEEDYIYKPKKGLNSEIIKEMSGMKNEPKWMHDFRLKSHEIFLKRPIPAWGGDLGGIDFDEIYYYSLL